MKNNRIIVISCTVLNLILITVCAVFYLQSDREKPEFKLAPSEITYRSQMQTKPLLEKISATDNQDGDISNNIVIEKIVENHKENSAIVFYAVSDKAGNVAKTSRVLKADFTTRDKDSKDGS